MVRTGELLEPLLVLKPKPGKWVGVLLTFAFFLAVGVFILRNDRRDGDEFMAWLCVVFCGLGVLVSMLQLSSKGNRTVVTDVGVHINTPFRASTFKWQDIEEFGVAEWSQWHGPFKQRHRMVGINLREGSEALEKARRISGLNTALVGYHDALPDNYGYKHQALADLLNTYLQKARAEQVN